MSRALPRSSLAAESPADAAPTWSCPIREARPIEDCERQPRRPPGRVGGGLSAHRQVRPIGAVRTAILQDRLDRRKLSGSVSADRATSQMSQAVDLQTFRRRAPARSAGRQSGREAVLRSTNGHRQDAGTGRKAGRPAIIRRSGASRCTADDAHRAQERRSHGRLAGTFLRTLAGARLS